jgi:hypothetical protein
LRGSDSEDVRVHCSRCVRIHLRPSQHRLTTARSIEPFDFDLQALRAAHTQRLSAGFHLDDLRKFFEDPDRGRDYVYSKHLIPYQRRRHHRMWIGVRHKLHLLHL